MTTKEHQSPANDNHGHESTMITDEDDASPTARFRKIALLVAGLASEDEQSIERRIRAANQLGHVKTFRGRSSSRP